MSSESFGHIKTLCYFSKNNDKYDFSKISSHRVKYHTISTAVTITWKSRCLQSIQLYLNLKFSYPKEAIRFVFRNVSILYEYWIIFVVFSLSFDFIIVDLLRINGAKHSSFFFLGGPKWQKPFPVTEPKCQKTAGGHAADVAPT